MVHRTEITLLFIILRCYIIIGVSLFYYHIFHILHHLCPFYLKLDAPWMFLSLLFSVFRWASLSHGLKLSYGLMDSGLLFKKGLPCFIGSSLGGLFPALLLIYCLVIARSTR